MEERMAHLHSRLRRVLTATRSLLRFPSCTLVATSLLVLILAAAVTSGAAPVVIGADDDAPDPYYPTNDSRIYVSDDPDSPALASVGDSESPSSEPSPREIAESLDILYPHPNPPATANGETLNQYRWGNLRTISRNRSTSLLFPRSEPRDHHVIKDHHVTILGQKSGAYVSFLGFDSLKQGAVQWIRGSGQVYNFADYRLDAGQLPTDQCSVRYQTTNHEHEVQTENGTKNVTRTHYIGGTKVCNEFYFGDLIEYRWMDIGEGEQKRTYYNTGNGRRISYSQVPEMNERQPLRIYHSLSVPVKKRIITSDWENTGDIHEKRGRWTVTNRTVQTNEWHNQTVTDEIDVLEKSSGVEDLAITQRVINISDNRKHIILDWETPGASPGTPIDPDELNQRPVWSQIQLSGDTVVRNGWGVYSIRRYGHARSGDRTFARRIGSDGEATTVTPPQVLWTWTFDAGGEPYVETEGNRGVGDTVRVVDADRRKVTEGGFLKPDRVNITRSGAPAVFPTVAIADADSSISEIYTVTGEQVGPASINTIHVEYRQPQIEIVDGVPGADGEEATLIVVTDPETGRPLPNRELSIRGAEQSTVYSNRKGVAKVDRSQPFLSVTHRADALVNHRGDVFYGERRVTKTYLNTGPLAQLLLDLLFAGLLVSPLIIFLIFWESNDLLRS